MTGNPGHLAVAANLPGKQARNRRLELADLGDSTPNGCHGLGSADGPLGFIGESDIPAFDDQTWIRVE